jgi:hypothetical protein
MNRIVGASAIGTAASFADLVRDAESRLPSEGRPDP